MVGKAAMQWVKPPAGQIHIAGHLGRIQPRQQPGKFWRMGGLNACLGAPLEIGLQALVSE